MHEHFVLILILLAIATSITAISKKFNSPYPIALVITGTIIGLFPISALDSLKEFIAEDEIFRFSIIAIFLPTLLGEATLKLPFHHLKENSRPIIALALFGTLISYIVIGFSANLMLGLSIQVAFTFAALMSATDPVSVLSIFKSLGVNKKLATVIEGESLFNDGIAVVLFNISSVYLLQYLDLGFLGLSYGLLEFIKVALGGLIIGAALGYLFSLLIKYYDDYPLEIIFSMILFYGSFFLAEQFHLSGVIAVVTAGLVFGNYGGRIGMSPTTKLNINNFWDVLALLANSLVFLMIGLEITNISLADKWQMIGIGIIIVLVSRSVAVYTSLAFIKKFPGSWKHVLNWGGLRGSLSIALALSLPLDFPAREDILVLAFSFVLFSLVFQGLSIKGFINFLGITKSSNQLIRYEELITQIHRIKKAKADLEKIRDEATISIHVYNKIHAEYSTKEDLFHGLLSELYLEYPELEEKQLERARSQMLYSEYDAVEELSRKHLVSDQVANVQKEEIIDSLQEK